MPSRYCIFRTDAIGDLILTLPMAFAIKAHDPSAEVTFCVQEYTRPAAALCPAIDKLLTVPARDLGRGIWTFADELRAEEFDTAVFAYPRPKLALAAKLAGIPQRIGTAYRFYSFMFTHKHQEHRRESIHHESSYNMNLLVHAGITGYKAIPPLLHVPTELSREADRILHEAGIGSNPLFILHPGSAGSSKDWPLESFGALGAVLTERYPGYDVLVTGSASEAPLVARVCAQIGPAAHQLPEPVALELFAAILARADVLVANSTGPLHLAAALGVPVIGLYPDEAVLAPRRWGPLGDTNIALTPQGVQNKELAGATDMNLISVEHVSEAVQGLLKGT